MIIDFHVHGFPDELARKAVPFLAEQAKVPARLNGTLEDIRKSMKKSGVDHSVVLSIATKPEQTKKINSWSSQAQAEDITVFGSIHPDYSGWKEELKRIKELGIKGIKYHPDYQQFYVDEKRMFPIYETAFDLGLIIVFHAGLDIGLKPPYHCTPERLLKVARSFPGGNMVAAHMGGYGYWDDVEKFLVGEDIYFDTSYSLGYIDDEQAIRIVRMHGYRKILFGTDSPWTDQSEEVDKIKRLDLREEELNAVLGGNAVRLLEPGLSHGG